MFDFLITGIAYVCAKYISAKWSGTWKRIAGYFAAFLLSWLCGGMLVLLLASFLLGGDVHQAAPIFFARGFWWAFLGMLFGIYMGKKPENVTFLKEISLTNQPLSSGESPIIKKIDSKHLTGSEGGTMNKQAAAITALAISIFSCSVGATSYQEKLLPSAESTEISLTWHMDGRAQLVTVKNDSRLVLTWAYLVCEIYNSTQPLPKRAPSGKKWCSIYPVSLMSHEEQNDIIYNQCDHPYAHKRSLDKTVLPGKSQEFYFETPDGELPPVSCKLEDLRGRAPKFWEF